MSALPEPTSRPLKIKGHPQVNQDVDEEEENGPLTNFDQFSAPPLSQTYEANKSLDAWAPCLQKFSLVVTFDPLRETSFEHVITKGALLDTWERDPCNSKLANLNFENSIVQSICIKNKEIPLCFDAYLKIMDAQNNILYNPIATFRHDGMVDVKTKTQKPSGTPLWGDQVGVRYVYQNLRKPTTNDLAYASFKVDTLKSGVQHLTYDIPVERHNRRPATQKLALTHVPKDPCAPFFEHALSIRSGAYPAGFTDSPTHAVAGMPHMFCLNTSDYTKVVEAFEERKKKIAMHDLSSFKVILEPASQATVLPAGPVCIVLDFEVISSCAYLTTRFTPKFSVSGLDG